MDPYLIDEDYLSLSAAPLSSLSLAEIKRPVSDPSSLKSKMTPLRPDSWGAREDTKRGPQAAFMFKSLYHLQKLTTVTSSRADSF